MKKTIRLTESELKSLIKESIDTLIESRSEFYPSIRQIRGGIDNLKRETNNICSIIANEGNFKVMDSQNQGGYIKYLKEYRDDIFKSLESMWDFYYRISGYKGQDDNTTKSHNPFSNEPPETFVGQAMKNERFN